MSIVEMMQYWTADKLMLENKLGSIRCEIVTKRFGAKFSKYNFQIKINKALN